MNEQQRKKITDTILGLASIHGKDMNLEATQLFVRALEQYDFNLVDASLNKCITDLPRFPTIADIVLNIKSNDGHLNSDAAWAMVPKTENESAFMTEEMSLAWNQVQDMFQTDQVGARMSFKAIYEKKVADARNEKRKAEYFFSRGQDKTTWESTIRNALANKIIGIDLAKACMPEITFRNIETLKIEDNESNLNKNLKIEKENILYVRKLLSDAILEKEINTEVESLNSRTPWTDESNAEKMKSITPTLEFADKQHEEKALLRTQSKVHRS